MSRVVYKRDLNEAIIDLFGQDISHVQTIEMKSGTAEITYWPELNDKSRKVIDTYVITNEEN